MLPALAVQCPRCRRAPWQPCLTPSGKLAKREHAARDRAAEAVNAR